MCYGKRVMPPSYLAYATHQLHEFLAVNHIIGLTNRWTPKALSSLDGGASHMIHIVQVYIKGKEDLNRFFFYFQLNLDYVDIPVFDKNMYLHYHQPKDVLLFSCILRLIDNPGK